MHKKEFTSIRSGVFGLAGGESRGGWTSAGSSAPTNSSAFSGSRASASSSDSESDSALSAEVEFASGTEAATLVCKWGVQVQYSRV